MQLALSTRMWQDRPLAEALEAARATGITALDLNAAYVHPHLRPTDGPDAVREARPLLKEWQVLVVSADHPDLARDRSEGGSDAMRYTLSAIKTARALGADVVSTSLGSTEIDAWDTAWERARRALMQIVQKSSASEVRLAIELNADDVLNSLKKARRLLEEIPHPRLGLTLDTAMLHYLRIQLNEALDVAGERLFHVHLRDATRTDPYRNIGAGEVSFPATFRALRQHGYEGPLSIELERTQERHGMTIDDALAEAVPKLQQWMEG